MEPLALDVPLPLLPMFRVDMVEDVVNHSQLNEGSRVEVFGLGGWTTVPIHQSLRSIERTSLRPSIQTSLSLEKTPGLEKLLDHQGRRLPSRTKRGAFELVSPSKPKIPRLNMDATPLPSLLKALANNANNTPPRPVVGGPAAAGRSALHRSETLRNDASTEPLKPRFPGTYLARDILFGLEEVDRKDGRKVGERYETTFKHRYTHSSLSALRTNAASVKPVFDTLDPGAQQAITWDSSRQPRFLPPHL